VIREPTKCSTDDGWAVGHMLMEEAERAATPELRERAVRTFFYRCQMLSSSSVLFPRLCTMLIALITNLPVADDGKDAAGTAGKGPSLLTLEEARALAARLLSILLLDSKQRAAIPSFSGSMLQSVRQAPDLSSSELGAASRRVVERYRDAALREMSSDYAWFTPLLEAILTRQKQRLQTQGKVHQAKQRAKSLVRSSIFVGSSVSAIDVEEEGDGSSTRSHASIAQASPSSDSESRGRGRGVNDFDGIAPSGDQLLPDGPMAEDVPQHCDIHVELRTADVTYLSSRHCDCGGVRVRVAASPPMHDTLGSI
jgi:hypothetical protein